MKDLIDNPDARPYGFPPALWMAMGHNERVVSHKEHLDPLCQFMLMCCILTNELEIVRKRLSNEQYDWKVYGIQKGYLNEIKMDKKKHPWEVKECLYQMDWYKCQEKKGLAVLPKDGTQYNMGRNESSNLKLY